MSRRNAYDFNASVNTAIEGEVGNLRINLLVRGIICSNCKNVIILNFICGDFYSETGITAVMNEKRCTVPEDFCRRVYCIKFQIVFFAFKLCFCNFLEIIAFLTLIVITAVLTVLAIPCVRKIKLFCACGDCGRICFFIHCKNPIFVNKFYSSHFKILSYIN